MRARTCATVRPGGRLGPLHCEPPLTLRRVAADRPGVCALCLVGSAAGPLAGDDLALDLRVEADAHATLRATGAAIAQGRRRDGQQDAHPASVRWCVDVGDRAHLVADPGPLVACAGSRVDVTVAITLGHASTLEWSELIVLGRSTDAAPGHATLRWDVTRAGHPLLRQRVDLGPPTWSQATAGHRVIASALLAGPEIKARTVVASRTAVAQRLDEHAVLLTVLDDSAARATRALAALHTELRAEL